MVKTSPGKKTPRGRRFQKGRESKSEAENKEALNKRSAYMGEPGESLQGIERKHGDRDSRRKRKTQGTRGLKTKVYIKNQRLQRRS